MQVIIEQDEITKGISVREQDVTEEFTSLASFTNSNDGVYTW